jgi:L-iditol 2-dehydrogenase
MVDERLRMAERLGADHIVDMRAFRTPEERVSEVLRLTNGLGADVVVECVGAPAAVPEGIDMTRRGGKYVEVGHYTDPGTVPVNPHTICFKDMDILGSWTYPPTQFGTVLELMRRSMGEIPLDEVVTKVYGVDEAQAAVDDLKARKGIKLAIKGR